MINCNTSYIMDQVFILKCNRLYMELRFKNTTFNKQK